MRNEGNNWQKVGFPYYFTKQDTVCWFLHTNLQNETQYG